METDREVKNLTRELRISEATIPCFGIKRRDSAQGGQHR